jgi:tetratricopeptide (TPR) repeat protein
MALCHRALSKYRQGDVAGAIDDCTEALKYERRISNVWAIRGGARLLKGEYDGAIADCDQALEINPVNAWAIGWRGSAKAGKEDYKGSVQDCGQALALEPPTTEEYIWTWGHTRCNTVYKTEELGQEIDSAIIGDTQFDLTERVARLQRAMKLGEGIVPQELMDRAQDRLDRWLAVLDAAAKFKEQDDNAKKAACLALAELRDPAAVPYLKEALYSQPNRFVRHKVIEAMGRIGDGSITSTLERVSQVSQKARDKETHAIANVAIFEIKQDIAGLEQALQHKRIQPWHQDAIEAALTRLRRAETEERERAAALLPT